MLRQWNPSLTTAVYLTTIWQVFYLDEKAHQKRVIEAIRSNDLDKIHDSQCTGKLVRVPIALLNNEQNRTESEDQNLVLVRSETAGGMRLSHMEDPDDMDDQRANLQEAIQSHRLEKYHAYIFNNCFMCSSNITFAIESEASLRASSGTPEQSTVSQEVVHFLLKFPLEPCNPKHPREPVQAFGALHNEHAFIVRGKDAKDHPQIHVFMTESDAERDQWIALLNRRSMKHEEAMEKDFMSTDGLVIEVDDIEDKIDPALAAAMREAEAARAEAKAELEASDDKTEEEREAARRRLSVAESQEKEARKQLNAMHAQLMQSVKKAEAVGQRKAPTTLTRGKSRGSLGITGSGLSEGEAAHAGIFKVGDTVHIDGGSEMWQVFEVHAQAADKVLRTAWHPPVSDTYLA